MADPINVSDVSDGLSFSDVINDMAPIFATSILDASSTLSDILNGRTPIRGSGLTDNLSLSLYNDILNDKMLIRISNIVDIPIFNDILNSKMPVFAGNLLDNLGATSLTDALKVRASILADDAVDNMSLSLYNDILNYIVPIPVNTILDLLTINDVLNGRLPYRLNTIIDDMGLIFLISDTGRLPIFVNDIIDIISLTDLVSKERLKRMATRYVSENKSKIMVGWGQFVDQTSTNDYVDIGILDVSFFRTKTFIFTAAVNNLLVKVLGSIDGGLTYDQTVETDISVTTTAAVTKTFGIPLTHIKIQVKSASAGSVGVLSTKHFQTWAETYAM
jgi:hypothetical protein